MAAKKIKDSVPTEDVIREYASKGATHQEMADFLKVDRATLTRHFSQAIAEGHADIRMKLREKQLQLALEGKGNVQMLIHLGKHMLGQRDELKVEAADNKLKDVDTEELTKFVKSKDGKPKLIKAVEQLAKEA